MNLLLALVLASPPMEPEVEPSEQPKPGVRMAPILPIVVPIWHPPVDTTGVLRPLPLIDPGVAGLTLAGMSEAESHWTINGFDITDPSDRARAITLPMELVSMVAVDSSGYMPEYGWASGGQVRTTTIEPSGGSLRGELGVWVSPRVVKPRLISPGDALRVTEIDDVRVQTYARIQGRIIVDRLFYTIGVILSRRSSTLNQQFRRHVDGATETFAEQSFATGATELGYLAQLDWHLRRDHRLRLAVMGGPSFERTSYRLPQNPEPNALGANPLIDPIGGTSRNATGIVNDHFGTTLRHQTAVVLGYEGEIEDEVGVEATLGYGQFVSQDAWRLDNPTLREIPATHYEGGNLHAHLDREGALALAPGVGEACGDDRPDACPTRAWVSGGLGEYDHDISRRVGARLVFSGTVRRPRIYRDHQLRGGLELDWTQRRGIYRYSGANADDISSRCAAGLVGGGEYCYDPRSDSYELDSSVRVSNNRFVLVDAAEPNLRRTRGFGTAQHERKDLRALADADGHGARVPAYDETVSSFNYALFMQDRWQPLPDLTVWGGLRWELQDMRDIYGKTKILIWDNVAPRIGVGYDWTGTGRSYINLDYGLYYQPLPLQLASRMFGGLVMVERSYRASDCEPGTTTLDGVSHPRIDEGQPSEWCPDQGGTTTGLSEAAIVPRLRGQYNHQFVLGYAQELVEELVVRMFWQHTQLGRAVEDVSTNGGRDFVLANPGVAVAAADLDEQRAACEALAVAGSAIKELRRCEAVLDTYAELGTAFAKPTRNYDGWTVQLDKLIADDWMLSASYTHSRLVGDYDGFVDPINGSITLGARGHYDTREQLRNGFGRLARDVPHRLRLNGYYGLDLRESGRLILGTSVSLRSGVPISVRVDDRYLLPRGSGGRVRPNAQWNVHVAYDYPLPKQLALMIGIKLLNVTSAKATLRVDELYSHDGAHPIVGGDAEDLAHAKIAGEGGGFFGRELVRPRANFGAPAQLQQPISAQFELSLRY